MNAIPVPTAVKIKMLQDSMRCFVCGLLSFIPVVGFILAVAAICYSFNAWRGEKQTWNVARPYRIMGMACAVVTSILWFCVIALLIYHASFPDSGGGSSYDHFD